MRVVFTDPAPLKTIVPWAITISLLLVWSYGVLAGDRLGGVAEACLVAGAAMVLVSLVLGRKLISIDSPSK